MEYISFKNRDYVVLGVERMLELVESYRDDMDQLCDSSVSVCHWKSVNWVDFDNIIKSCNNEEVLQLLINSSIKGMSIMSYDIDDVTYNIMLIKNEGKSDTITCNLINGDTLTVITTSDHTILTQSNQLLVRKCICAEYIKYKDLVPTVDDYKISNERSNCKLAFDILTYICAADQMYSRDNSNTSAKCKLIIETGSKFKPHPWLSSFKQKVREYYEML